MKYDIYREPVSPGVRNTRLRNSITKFVCISHIIERIALIVNIAFRTHHTIRLQHIFSIRCTPNAMSQAQLTLSSMPVNKQIVKKFDSTTIKLCGNVASLLESEAA
jgi:hypothetical protein